ncbi:hypothetical protein CALCODRAFT_500870 [Calocera cornea HHB12733]|uniref:Uncharacterized protein n=1 Tax=Calocera cornea HHB12733 TaxID=1353952 RepID=A0A165DVG1_9BASI|nr:hypothetical protein CALCODRAFT_500870 [Calocera cornea HHB12733]
MAPRHTVVLASSSSPEIMDIDSDDEDDFVENVVLAGRNPTQVRPVARASGLDRFGPPLPPAPVSPVNNARTGTNASRTASGSVHPKGAIPPLWTPGCKRCSNPSKGAKKKCRAWPGEKCTNCKKSRQPCNLSATNSQSTPASTAISMPPPAPPAARVPNAPNERARPAPTGTPRPIVQSVAQRAPNPASSIDRMRPVPNGSVQTASQSTSQSTRHPPAALLNYRQNVHGSQPALQSPNQAAKPLNERDHLNSKTAQLSSQATASGPKDPHATQAPVQTTRPAAETSRTRLQPLNDRVSDSPAPRADDDKVFTRPVVPLPAGGNLRVGPPVSRPRKRTDRPMYAASASPPPLGRPFPMQLPSVTPSGSTPSASSRKRSVSPEFAIDAPSKRLRISLVSQSNRAEAGSLAAPAARNTRVAPAVQPEAPHHSEAPGQINIKEEDAIEDSVLIIEADGTEVMPTVGMQERVFTIEYTNLKMTLKGIMGKPLYAKAENALHTFEATMLKVFV